MKKTILHLCADTGSDSKPYRDAGYNVILIGKDIGVENYHPPAGVYGIIANPVCTEFSAARADNGIWKKKRPANLEEGMRLVNECVRIIKEADPVWWAIENPATGRLRDFLGPPKLTYQPWEYGSPWTKKTGVWGTFKAPPKLYTRWADVPKIEALYVRPNRQKPSLAFLHARKHMTSIPEFAPFYAEILKKPARDKINGGGGDAEFRSLCSQKFAQAFFKANP